MAQAAQKKTQGRKLLGALALLFVLAGLYFGLIEAPPDAYQGDVQRIMYLHIPSILTAYLSFFIVFVGSCLFLWKREKRDDILASSAAEIGVLFTALTLLEGSIWGKPTWGVWWTWDARLTLTAILLLIFIGYLMLRSLIEDENRAAVCSAVLGIIGFLDIPLIHMSVYWWRTLHQPPSILRPDKMPWENIHPSMLIALSVNFVAFILLYFYLLSLRFRVGEMEEEAKTRKLYGGSAKLTAMSMSNGGSL
jgi:heme exporter protein C